MLWLKKINADIYLKDFVSFCKERYEDNLTAIIIYGSYPWGYFDKKKSDYDVFVIFKTKTPKSKKLAQKEFLRKFPKISLQYFCTTDELLRKVEEGHWSIYITLLKSAKILYYTKEYKKFLKELKKVDFIEQLMDTAAMEYKANFEIETLKKSRGYKAAKWALPSIRKRLQLLTYIRRKKAIWNIKKIVRLNKDILTKEERDFIVDLDKRVKKRENSFTKIDKNKSIEILKKLNHQILFKELASLRI
ncbi:MAG: nucleotidyltransferase domain-containing protein [bacterium]|nr:nucleotidyltransferase domain-containing protein [bacterium]